MRVYRGTDNAWQDAVISQCGALQQGYNPPSWARRNHMQTILYVLWESRARVLTWDDDQRLVLEDGGTVSIQWLGLDLPPETPVIVLLHTIMGYGDQLRRMVRAIHDLTGWVVAACNRRGHGDLPLTAPRVNTMGSTADLTQQLIAIEERRPRARLYGLGVSAGSGLLVRYLGETADESRLTAAVAYCPGYDLEKAFSFVHPWYDHYLTRELKRYFLERYRDVWSDHPGIERLHDARSLREFHDLHYLISGYDSPEEHYAASNPIVVADTATTPLLVLNAEDDPVCTADNVLMHLDRMLALPRLTLAFTPRGGHCGFFDGLDGRNWADRLVADYLIAADQLLHD